MLSRRGALSRIGVAAIATALTPGFAITALALTDYPSRPVRIILPYGPGGVADVSTRIVAQKLSEKTGQNFFVDNRPGAGGIVAAKGALSLPADGYTLYLSGNGATISESLFAELPFSITRDFTPVSLLAKFDMLLATKADSQLDTVPKIVGFAKNNPGKLNFGSIAVGSTQNLSAELFRMVTGVNAQIVTFRTTPDLSTALARGDVDIGFDYYAAFNPMVAAKQIKIIASSGEKPVPELGNVPTVKDSGYPAFIVMSWNALSARAGTPADIIVKLNADISAVLKMPEIGKQMAELGMEPLASSPEQLTERLNADTAKWREVIEKAGIPKQ
jgi:tripartite-type tricarboxylate transporter receptor subunit TctC